MAENPTYAGVVTNDAQINALRQWERDQQQLQAAITNPPAERIAATIADLVGRGSINQLQNSPNIMDQAFGRLMPIAGAFAANAMGLSTSTMVAGMSSIFETGGTMLRTQGGYEPLAGFTPAGSQISSRMFELASRTFMHPGGALNMDTTYGASRDDIGNTFNELQRRGVFAGDIAGSAQRMNPGLRSQMINQAMQVGDLDGARELESIADGSSVYKPNDALVSKISQWGRSTLQSVQELRQVLGNLDVGSILGELERLTGMDIGRPGNLSAAMMDFRRRVAQGQAAGLDARESLEFTAATASTMDAHMSGRMGLPQGALQDVAATMAGSVDRYSLAAYQSQRAAGGYRTLPEVATAMASDVSKVMSDSPELLEAMFAASRMQQGSGAYTGMMNSIEAYSSAGTAQQRESALQAMANMTTQTLGTRSGGLIETMGADNILRHVQNTAPGVLDKGVDAVLRSNQSAMSYDFGRIMDAMDSSGPYAKALGGTDRAASFAQSMFQNFSGAEMKQMLSAGGLDEMLAVAGDRTLPGFGSAATAISAAQARISAASGGRVGVADFLGLTNDMVQGSPAMASMVGGGALASLDGGVQSIASVNLAGKGMQPLSIREQLEQGLLGGGVPLEDQALITYGTRNKHSSMRTIGFNDEGGLNATEDQAADLAKALAGKYNLYDMMGVKSNDKAGLAKALKSSAASDLVMRAMQDSDVLGGVGSGDDGSRSLIISTDKKGLKDAYDKELETLRGAQSKAAPAPPNGAAVSVIFNLTDGQGQIKTMTGNAQNLRTA